jgi:hypothetical protein
MKTKRRRTENEPSESSVFGFHAGRIGSLQRQMFKSAGALLFPNNDDKQEKKDDEQGGECSGKADAEGERIVLCVRELVLHALLSLCELQFLGEDV